jgi:hypothetical protein
LKENEKIIKEGFLHYRGWFNKPVLSTCFGKIYLTNQRLFLEYFLLGIPTTNKVYGLFKREIEIPLSKIKDVKKVLPDTIRLDYMTNGKLETMSFVPYPFPWKTIATFFKSRFTTNIIKLANEWVEEIRKLLKM